MWAENRTRRKMQICSGWGLEEINMAKHKRKASRRRHSRRRHRRLGEVESMGLMGLGSHYDDSAMLGQVPSAGLFSTRNLLIAGAALVAYVLLRKPAGQKVVEKAAEAVEKAGEAVKSVAEGTAAAVTAAVPPATQVTTAAQAGLGAGYYSGWQGQGDPGTAFHADGRGFTYGRYN